MRLRNFIAPSDFPYRSPTGAVYDSGDHAAALERALALVGYEDLRRGGAGRYDSSRDLVGIGISSYIERAGGQGGSVEFGSVEVADDGSIVARSGSTPQGQGHATVFAQVVADVLEIDTGHIRIVQGDTDEVPSGTGTFGSRSLQVGGDALHRAAHELVAKARERAAIHLEVAPDDLRYSAGRFTVAGTDRGVDLIALSAEPLAAAVESAPPQTFPFGTHIAVVAIDPETGEVRVKELVAVEDCGTVVHPKIVEGQVTGSLVQGLGQALYELAPYDDDGQPLATTLMDYPLPTMSETPGIEVVHNVTPTPHTALGAKGAGETGCIGAPPAIVNAIIDALAWDGELDMPVTPEKVWRVLDRIDRGLQDDHH